MSRRNFILTCVEHEKSFMTSGPDLSFFFAMYIPLFIQIFIDQAAHFCMYIWGSVIFICPLAYILHIFTDIYDIQNGIQKKVSGLIRVCIPRIQKKVS